MKPRRSQRVKPKTKKGDSSPEVANADPKPIKNVSSLINLKPKKIELSKEELDLLNNHRE
jgi:hypothetical protein